ncbi:sigma-70 family RNA polymerase sigma factor [Microbacterium sp. ZXX196]|uniref:sigma-70 family RNA polymerase sigma factor n=1 Tax=Microbacterium sp. ZXX196 TaxID=2609291 RepID=UPI0018ACCDD9|nr:sigma-70 family RNA polymerase sigma factor [Microbacterium sp. ZXX196]
MPDTREARISDASHVSDVDLVTRTREGDTSAFGELWTRHYRSGITAARSITTSIDPDDLVQEAYTRIFQTVARGGGPTGSFRAYLFTAIRNTAASWGRARHEVAIDEVELIADPATTDAATEEALDRGLTHTAFRSLPTRWQEVLWYTEIEQMKPREIAPLVGMRAGAVAQLAVRAREGLREAWIQAHISASAEGSEHAWVLDRLGARTRGNLSSRDRKRIESHLGECTRCAIVADEAEDVGSRLAMVLLPLAIGVPAAGAYLAALQRGEEAVVALAAMPPSVVEGAGGAVVAGGAATGGHASSGGSAGAGAAWTVGGVLVGGASAAVLVAAVAISSFTGGPASSSAASDQFSSGSMTEDAETRASDDLTEATQAEETDPPAAQEEDAPRAALDISGARVVDAAEGTVALDVAGSAGAPVSAHVDGSTTVVATGFAGHLALAAARTVGGPAVGEAVLDSDGFSTLVVRVTADQVEDDAAITVVYADGADAPARSTLSALGVRDALRQALRADEPEPERASPRREAESDRSAATVAPPAEYVAPPAEAEGGPEPEEPVTPVDPAEPVDPTEPVGPTEPVDPTDPVDPTEPVDPEDPDEPTDPEEPAPLAAPTAVAATATEPHTVTIRWEGVDDAEAYRVYRTDDGALADAQLVDETAELTAVDIEVPPGTHAYVVLATAGERESAASDPATVDVALGAPQDVAVTSSGRVTWAPVDGAAEYVVTRSGPEGAATTLGATAETSFLDEETLAAGTYSYTVTASGPSAPSSAPSAPAAREVAETPLTIVAAERADEIDGAAFYAVTVTGRPGARVELQMHNIDMANSVAAGALNSTGTATLRVLVADRAHDRDLTLSYALGFGDGVTTTISALAPAV